MASDDWGRGLPPTRVSISALLKRNPKHADCDLVIHRSDKNRDYVGLYCCQHRHWMSWLNPYQVYFLESLGIANPQNCNSQRWDEQEYYRSLNEYEEYCRKHQRAPQWNSIIRD